MTDTYPQAGTTAHRILEFIRANPGASKNAIVRALDLNPSPTRDIIKNLLDKGLIRDDPNKQGHHAYHATSPVDTRAR